MQELRAKRALRAPISFPGFNRRFLKCKKISAH